MTAQRNIKHAIDNKAGPYSTYASYEALHDAVVPIFNENDIFVSQHSYERSGAVCIETILMFNDVLKKNEYFRTGLVPVPVKGDGPQAFGSAMTYCRRYSLGLAAGIGHQSDDDAQAAENAQSGTAVDLEIVENSLQETTFTYFYEERLKSNPDAQKPASINDLTQAEIDIASRALRRQNK